MEEYDEETGPSYPLDMNKVTRTILADKPRVTRFQINWGDSDLSKQQQQGGEGIVQQDGERGEDVAMSMASNNDTMMDTNSNNMQGYGVASLPQDNQTDVTMISTE